MDPSKAILHELYVYCEWSPEPEYIQKSDGLLPEKISSIKRWLKHLGPKKTLFDSITAHKERQQKWHIALGDEGKVIAVLTDTILEIRTKRSDYATIAARTTVTRDPYPQWRRMEWSPDCAFLVVTYGIGNVEFYDLSASKLFTIDYECSRPGGLECTDTAHAIARIIFLPLRAKSTEIKWNWEVLLVSYDGSVRAYMISLTEGYAFHYKVQFKGGLSAADYCHLHNTMYVAKLPYTSGTDPEAAYRFGLTAWRLISEAPHYKLSVVSDNIAAQVNEKFYYYIPYMSKKKMVVIIEMQLSPDAGKLVCLHSTGDISVWRLPLLKLLHRFPLLAQPGHDLRNPLVEDKLGKIDPAVFHAADINWWSNEELIVSRFSGCVSVCDVRSLANLLSGGAEFLQGAPRVTRACAAGFLALECEAAVLPARRSPSDETVEVVKDEEEDSSVFETVKEMLKTVAFAITDIETFQPKPRRITCMSRVYRLLAVKSTTPQELFSRKIESGQYSEALKLADTFKLDSDLVYQQQWRKNPVSTDAIQKYLSKVSKKIWAVHQCVDRLPETLPAAKELLQFGLELTNQHILEEINKGEGKERVTSHEAITVDDLNSYTSELLRCRHVMLFYKERLFLYELILKEEKSTYDKDEYDRLRCNSILYSSIEIAKEGRILALHCLWSHISTADMKLAILEKLPETIPPFAYHHLLPTVNPLDAELVQSVCDSRGELSPRAEVPPLHTERDWCRNPMFRSIWSSNWSEQSSPDSEATSELSQEGDLTTWYLKRAYEIEERSGMAYNALSLLTLASRGGGVAGLDKMLFNLTTLNTLIYELNMEGITLRELETMTPIQICKALMSKSSPETFIADLENILMPYLKRYETLKGEERSRKVLNGYLEDISMEDLCPILLLMENQEDYHMDVETRINTAYNCLMAYNGTEQLDIASDILAAITPPAGNIKRTVSIRLKEFERMVRASSALLARGIAVAPRDLCPVGGMDSHNALVLLNRLARDLSKSETKPTQADWEKLLKDIMALQESCFYFMTKDTCFAIYASALLTSGDLSSIKLAASVLTTDSNRAGPNPDAVIYNHSVSLVLDAAKEYFNSASSLTDPALELAKCCLTLIKDGHPDIQAELDLIAALHILHSFNVSMLPIQVRLNDNKLKLIQECLEADPSAHQSSHKLIQLAELLRYEADDEVAREGDVLITMCQHANDKEMWSSSVDAALRLAALRIERAAPYLAKVATHASADRETKRELFAAAITHCPPDCIESLLTSRLQLQLEGLAQMGVTMKDASQLPDRCPSTDDEFTDAITTPIVEKKDLVPSRSEKKLPLFNYLLDSFQNKFSVHQARAQPQEAKRAIHMHEFYHTLYPEYEISDNYYRYDRFAVPDALEGRAAAGHAVLQWYYLTSLLTKGPELELEPEVIQKCAEELIYSDTSVGVACLLRGTNDNAEATRRFVVSAHSDIAVSCALYAATANCTYPTLKDEVYLMHPRTLADKALQNQNVLEDQKQLIRECIDRLSGMEEIESLKARGMNVNGLLFSADADYRREIILRLARQPGKDNLSLALTLSEKYNEDTLEAWLQHACAGPTQLHLTAHSLPKAERAFDRIYRTLYHDISGVNHAALLQMFTVLLGLDEKQAVAGLSAADHIKLLKKCKAASPELDYKLVIEHTSTEALTRHLLQILKPENIGMVAKFLRTLPPSIKLPISVNSIYTKWLTKYFFSMPPAHESSKKWMQQYRQCASYFNKLSKEELLKFLEHTCFSPDAVQRVPHGTRNLMLLQAVDYCSQEQENEIKSKKDEQSWAQVGQELSRWARFLDNFHSLSVAHLLQHMRIEDHFWQDLETSHGDVTKVVKTVSSLLYTPEVHPAGVTSLLQCLNVDIDAVELFRYAAAHVANAQHCDRLVESLSIYGEVMLPDDVIKQLLKKAMYFALPAHRQIEIMSRREGDRSATGGDLPAIARFSVELLRTGWPDLPHVRDLTEESLLNAEGRRAAFEAVRGATHTLKQRKMLVDVLACWPPDKDSSDRSLQCNYLCERLQGTAVKEATLYIHQLMKRPALDDEEIQWLMQNSPPASVLNMMSIIILSRSAATKDFLLKIINENEECFKDIEIDRWMYTKLLDLDMLIPLVPTALYPRLTEFFVENKEKPYTVEWAVERLYEAGHLAEVGHLYLMASGVPEPLRGFTETLLYCKNEFLFKRNAQQ